MRKRLVAELLRRAEELRPVKGLVCKGGTDALRVGGKVQHAVEAVSGKVNALAKTGLIEKRGTKLMLRDLTALYDL